MTSTLLQTRENVRKCHAYAKRHYNLLWNLEKEMFCSFPIDTATAEESQRIEARHVGASKRAFRARLPPSILCSFKIDIFLRLFSWTSKFATSKSIRFRQFSAHLTKCHACHGICTLSPLDTALTMRFAKNTQHDTSKVLRLPRKMTMVVSRVLRLPRKMQSIFWKRRKSIALATQNDFPHVTITSICHEVPRLPRETKLRNAGNFQRWPLLQKSP